MRKIKFRAWDGSSWIYSECVSKDGDNWWILNSEDDSWYTCLNPQQYTGLKDFHGSEIYEGDIVKNPFGDEHKIVWDEKRCQFIALTTNEDGSEWYQSLSRNFKIIGNIHEGKNITK
ncbi:YopX protein [Bacillus thuringiensis]|uniref:YopX protein n=1 Tax=Bacillus thuringiensis TaxID=1428 RepID=A0A4R4BMK8_BACTU|nr:YopX family protein [Bacillus thuringiensis]TCW59074.1 YopX protein [Bacillus thuringiensis]TCW59686.1 YopX protein [Bacillus thuringiensis]